MCSYLRKFFTFTVALNQSDCMLFNLCLFYSEIKFLFVMVAGGENEELLNIHVAGCRHCIKTIHFGEHI